MADPILLKNITSADKATALFQKRRPPEAEVNRKFYDGDHYQGSLGYMGQLPPAGLRFRNETLKEIEEGFISENVIKEVTDRHIAGPLGRECLWGFLPAEIPSPSATRRRKVFSKLFSLVSPQPVAADTEATANIATEADEACTVWWDKRRPRNTLKDALITALLEDRALIRVFFPPGLRDVQGKLRNASRLPEALNIPRLNVVTADKGGIFTDEATEEDFGVYIYQNADKKQVAEVTFVSGSTTVLRMIVEKEKPQEFTFDLGGRLLMYELRREALISEQVRSNQKALNLALTSMMRNVNLAGNLERTVFNAERPKKTVRVSDSSELGYHEELRDADYETGAGATMFLAGLLIRNDQGEVIGRANPNISFRQPVQVETFTGTRDQFYAAILGQCQQRHMLISGDATASGRSREQARAEFKGSVMLSKEVIDDAGRWMMETQLRLGAQLCNRSREFLGLRCEFNSIIEDGPIDSTDRQENRADVEAGLMSKETAMTRNGVEDTEAEVERIEEDKSKEPAPIDLSKDNGEDRLPA